MWMQWAPFMMIAQVKVGRFCRFYQSDKDQLPGLVEALVPSATIGLPSIDDETV